MIKVNVLVVDDQLMLRRGIVNLLRADPGIESVREAGSVEQAIALSRDQPADIILLELQLPGVGGLEAVRRMQRNAPGSRIIILSAHRRAPLPRMALQAGASAFVTKFVDPDEVLIAIRKVIAGETYVSSDIANEMAVAGGNRGGGSPFNQLSDREMQVCMMICRCEKVPQIAEQLHLSTKTVNTYRYRIFEKLGINSDVELVLQAISFGLLELAA